MREPVTGMPDYCFVEAAMAVVGGKWKLAILNRLRGGSLRFGELRRAMPTVAARMLTRQLRELEADGLLARRVHAEVPPRVEYSLTDVGRTLEPLLDQLDCWGAWYRQRTLGGPSR